VAAREQLAASTLALHAAEATVARKEVDMGEAILNVFQSYADPPQPVILKRKAAQLEVAAWATAHPCPYIVIMSIYGN